MRFVLLGCVEEATIVVVDSVHVGLDSRGGGCGTSGCRGKCGSVLVSAAIAVCVALRIGWGSGGGAARFFASLALEVFTARAVSAAVASATADT